MCKDDFAMRCERLLTRADSMLGSSIDLINQARFAEARQQILDCCSALTEAIEILQTHRL